MTLNIDYVRAQFPGLNTDWTYFDNAGGSQVLQSVADRMREYLLTSAVQHGASYDNSQLAMSRVAEATSAMAAYFNAEHSSEIIFGSSTSMVLRTLSQSLVRTWEKGDEVIVTNSDHESNIGPWVDLQRQGIVVKVWQVNRDTYEQDAEDLKNLLTEKTRLVAVTHTSNILGTVNPIAAYARIVHDHGALICVDGVAYAPHAAIDVQAWDVDFYVVSLYKVFGAHQAVLYGRHEILEQLPGVNHFFLEDSVPYKFQPGGVNYELCYGSLGLTDYINKLATTQNGDNVTLGQREKIDSVFELIAGHEECLSERLLDFLKCKPGVRIIGSTAHQHQKRMPTVSFVVNDRMSDDIVAMVDKHKIGIRFGDFYVRRLINDLGLTANNGVIRVSMVHYNTVVEVDQLVRVLEAIL